MATDLITARQTLGGIEWKKDIDTGWFASHNGWLGLDRRDQGLDRAEDGGRTKIRIDETSENRAILPGNKADARQLDRSRPYGVGFRRYRARRLDLDRTTDRSSWTLFGGSRWRTA